MESFGAVLRRAIQAEFGSNKAFAQALGVSPGRVSQIIGGPESVDPATLAKLLKAFSSLLNQTVVYEAWVREFAPPPVEEGLALDSEDARQQAIGLWHGDRPAEGLRLAEVHRQHVTDPQLWQELSSVALMINLRLGRRGEALKIARELEERSRADQEAGYLLTATWMRFLALRNLDRAPLKLIHRAYQDAVSLAYAREPLGDWKGRWLAKRLELQRDFALQVLTIAERKPVDDETLAEAMQVVNATLGRWEDPAAETMGLEVRARIEVVLGQLSKAEDTLDEVESRRWHTSTELRDKANLVRARIAIERGELEEARFLLQAIADACLERGNVHHFQIADQLLAELELGLLPRPDRPKGQ